MKKHLLEQVERINDEAANGPISVIVQMETQDDLSQILETATQTIQRRRVTIAAHDLLPPAAETMGKVGDRNQPPP